MQIGNDKNESDKTVLVLQEFRNGYENVIEI